METNRANLTAVKELVLDEHKLVTYISVSKELCIHVNEAKSLLSKFIQDIRNAQPETNLRISYVISGLLNNNSGCVTVCSEKDLDTLKKTLKVIFYEHVYCVSRGTKSVDNVALTVIDKFEDLPLCTGLIKANSCSKRTDIEIGNLISKNHAILNVPKSLSAEQKPKDKIKEIKSMSESKLAPNVKPKIPSPKKDISNKQKTPTKANNNKTAGKSIAGFFSKVNSDFTKANKAKFHETEIKLEKDIKIEPTSIDTNISPAVTNDSSNIVKTKANNIKIESNASSNSVKTKANNNKGLTQLKKNAKVDKKRKRLLHVSDSESEAEETDCFKQNKMDIDHQSEDEIPPTPTISTVKITSGIVNPKKRRKIVDKTYTDEDGYILTKKEEVYESFSENEEEAKENTEQIKENGKQEKDHVIRTKQNTDQAKVVKNEPSPKKNKSKKLSPPKKGKQPTINNFFKKV